MEYLTWRNVGGDTFRSRMMQKIAETLDFQAETMVKVRHKIDERLPNSYFCDYSG